MGDSRSWREIAANGWTLIRKPLWTLIGIVAAAMLLARLLFGGDALAYLSVVGCLYLVFVLEGIQVVAIHLTAVDRQGLEEFLCKENHFGEKSKDVVLRLRDLLARRYDDFVIGRQIFTIMAVVGLAYALGNTAVPLERLTGVAGENAGVAAASINHWATTFAISSLLPSWVSQLLPQFMSNKRAVEFVATLPTSSVFVTRSALLISTLGAGVPGQWLFNIVQRTGRFVNEERIPLGAEQLFTQTAEYYGSHIKRLELEVFAEEDKCTVTETVELAFTSGARREATYSLKARNVTGDVEWHLKDGDLPDGVERGEGQPIKHTLVTHMPKEDGTAQRWEETTASITYPLSVAIPRGGKNVETVRLRASYTALPFLLNGKPNRVYLDITRPTQIVAIKLRSADNLMIQEPTFETGLSGEMIGAGSVNSLHLGGRVSESDRKGEWRLVADYPPLGNRYVVGFAVFRKAKRG